LIPAAQAEDFTVVALPDTQMYARLYPDIFYSQTNWIANNVQSLNIKAVVGLGDIVDGGGSLQQWQVADTAYRALDGIVPYAAAIGNHDYDQGDSNIAGRTAVTLNFNRFFGPSRYAGYSWYGGQYPSGSNENFFIRFEANGKKFLVLVLEFYPRQESISWAAGVLKANSDSEVIVVTHSFLYGDNTRVNTCDPYSAETYGLGADYDGDEMWQKLIRRYSNIIMVLSGHIVDYHGIARRADIGVNGNLVNEVLSNYQAYTEGGDGYLRILKFHPDLNQIEVSTYSPYLNQYLTDERNQFALTYKNIAPLPPGNGEVTGKVRDQNCNALSGAHVNYTGGSTTTDSLGRYSISLPGPGSMYITAAQSGKWTTLKAYINPGYSESLDFIVQQDTTSDPAPQPAPACSVDLGVKICAPADGASVGDQMELQAAAASPTGISNTQVWVDGQKKYQVSGGALDTAVALVQGTHRISVTALDENGTVYKQTIYISDGTPACSATSGVVICSPANNSAVSTQMPITAAATSATGISNMQVWVDGQKKYQVNGGNLDTSISLAAGNHRIAVVALDMNASTYKQTIYVTAQ
jgi:hypothetical protein